MKQNVRDGVHVASGYQEAAVEVISLILLQTQEILPFFLDDQCSSNLTIS